MWKDEAIKLLEGTLNGLFPKEENRLDWKVDMSNNKNRIYEHLSAFANYPGGGYLVFGVNDKGEVKGLINKDTADRIGSMARDGFEPPISIDHKLVTFRGEGVLIIKISESLEKPVHIRSKSIEYSFIRSGGQTRKMSKFDLKDALINSASSRYEEILSLGGINEGDLDKYLDVDKYMDLRQKQGMSVEPKIAILEKENLVKKQPDGKYGITNLGMLLCAKEFSLFGKGFLGVKVIKYSDKSKLHATNEKIFNGGYAINLESVLDHIVDILPHSEIIKDALRVDTPLYPRTSMRELLANAVVHQILHRESGYVLVEIFSDRIVFTNPGLLLPSIKIDQLINAHPQSRNELLAKHMRLLGYCEERGSGIDRAISEVEFFGLPAIDFSQSSDAFRATIFTPKTYAEMTSDERVKACYQHACLKYVTGDKMTRPTLIKRLNIPYDVAASRLIKDAIDRGMIKIGDPNNKSKRFSFYVPYWA